MLAAALAGCNAQTSARLDPAAPQAAAQPVPGQSVIVQPKPLPEKTAQTDKAETKDAPPLVTAFVPAMAPVPVARPNFGDRVMVATKTAPADAAKTAAAPAQTAPAAAVAPAGALAMAAVERQKPVQVAALMQPVAAPQAAEEDPEPPVSASEAAGVKERSFNAYEDRVAGEAEGEPQKSAAKSTGPVIQTTAAGTPAVVETNGAIRTIGTGAPRRAVMASLAGSPTFSGPVSGRGWRAAYPNVRTHCFDRTLRAALENISRRFGAEVEVTSGYRTNGRRRSMHRFCRAADIRIPGVAPSQLARYARTIPGINGVGTYRRKSIVHIDTRLQQMVWRY